MNKTAIIAIIAVVVAGAAGAGGYWIYNNFFNDAAMASRALGGSGAVTCTVTYEDTGDEGTVYIRDGDIRTQSEVEGGLTSTDVDSQETTDAHMILRDETMYVWADGEDQGMEFSYEDGSMFEQFADEDDMPFTDYEDEAELKTQMEEYQADCSRGADAALFELPAEVEFVDWEDMFGDMMQDDGFGDFENMEEELEETSESSQEELDQAMEELEQLE